MTGIEEGRGEDSAEAPGAGPRAGSRALALFVPPLTLPVLRALELAPRRLAELRKDVGLPPQTTLRGHLTSLAETGAIAKRLCLESRQGTEYELTPMGRELLGVADSLEFWLELAPEGPIALSEGIGKGAVRALVDGWSSRIVRALAARPLSLTELDMLIPDLNYPALERRLASMRMAGLVEATQSSGFRTPYEMSAWGRRAIVPLARATRCERKHLADATPRPAPIDIEAAFMLTLPLVALAKASGGWCQMQVESRDEGTRTAAVRVDVEAGRVVSCASRFDPKARHWAAGSSAQWFEAIDSGDSSRLRFGGGRRLGEALVKGLHGALAQREGAAPSLAATQ